MKLDINISIPDLWGEQRFQKSEWGSINYLVGPNATGKTRFVEQLKQQCQNQKFKVRYISSERLAGLEKENYSYFSSSGIYQGLNIGQFNEYKDYGSRYGLVSDAFATMKEKLDVKIKIEATLSQLFGRRIRLAEEGGFLKPKIQKIEAGSEYGLKESECHGLKELITLLTFLYNDEYNCLIIDEPELHLHPQFQTFFLQEVRKIAGDPLSSPDKKCFFIVTHSPYYVDIRTLGDLKYCIVFQLDKLPACIEQLEGEDEWRIRRLLPRLNTHHKQFFFASRPIFVEGYSDQQIFSLIQEKRGKLLGASGSCIIDVRGKDELDLFFRICKKLNIDAQFITDLDVLTKGKLRQSVSEDERCGKYLQSEGLGTNLMDVIGKAEEAIDKCVTEVESNLANTAELNLPFQNFQHALCKESELEKKRYVFLVGLKYVGEQIKGLVESNAENLSFIEGRLQKISEAFKRSGVHVLSKGELENYLPEYEGNPYTISDDAKARTFERERDFILGNVLTEVEIRARYGDLINILDEATNPKEIDVDLFLTYAIRNWIYNVQSAYNRGEVKDEDSLKRNALIDWQTHSRIFDLQEFSRNRDGFTCRIKLKPLLDPKERELIFDNRLSAANYQLHGTQTSANHR
jgi:hypothetical protein